MIAASFIAKERPPAACFRAAAISAASGSKRARSCKHGDTVGKAQCGIKRIFFIACLAELHLRKPRLQQPHRRAEARDKQAGQPHVRRACPCLGKAAGDPLKHCVRSLLRRNEVRICAALAVRCQNVPFFVKQKEICFGATPIAYKVQHFHPVFSSAPGSGSGKPPPLSRYVHPPRAGLHCTEWAASRLGPGTCFLSSIQCAVQ